jgi:hypothetical protein
MELKLGTTKSRPNFKSTTRDEQQICTSGSKKTGKPQIGEGIDQR